MQTKAEFFQLLCDSHCDQMLSLAAAQFVIKVNHMQPEIGMRFPA